MTVQIACPDGHLVTLASRKLGSVVVCPCCFVAFQSHDSAAAKYAQPRKSTRRSRDDDDDDDDDDDEEDDDEEDEDDEEPIEWTTKKRQLAVVSKGITAYTISFYIILVMFLLLALVEVPWTIMLVIYLFTGDMSIANFLVGVMMVIAGIGAVPVFICHLVAWITGLFAPAKSEARGMSMTALVLFVTPIFLYIAYFIITLIMRDMRPEVAANLLRLFSTIAMMLWLGAFYCSLIQLGCISGYMGLTLDKRKPQALAWFIVGGALLYTVCLVAIMFVPWWALYIVAVFTYNVFYFILSSIRQLIGVADRTNKAIHDHIRDG